MHAQPPPARPLDDLRVHVRVKLSLLWASVVLCYLYGDYFDLYLPGRLQSMLDGRMGFDTPVTQGVLFGTALVMVIPCLMVFLSLALPPTLSRLANILLGALYSILMVITIHGTWAFYQFLGVVEIALTLLAVWYAWTWPRQGEREAHS